MLSIKLNKNNIYSINIINNIYEIINWVFDNQKLLFNCLINFIISGIILTLGISMSKNIPILINNLMKKRNIDTTISDFLLSILKYAILIITTILSLRCIGVQTTSVITVIGAAGLTVGLALQGSLSNFAAGVLLVSFRYFRSGDYVDIGGISGTVLIVQILTTKLKTYDGKTVIVPNNKVLSSNIINFSDDPNKLIDIVISVDYNSDIKLVKKIITKILYSDDRIIKEKGIVVSLRTLTNSLDFIIRAWVLKNNLQNTLFDILNKVKNKFNKNKIKIFSPSINILKNK